jgi:integrase
MPEGFRKLPSGRIQWRVMVDHRQMSGTSATLAAARHARSQAILDAGSRPADTPTVGEAIEMYLADVEQSAATGDSQTWARAKLPDAFLERRVADVDATVAAALWRQLEAAGVSRHAQRKASNLLSKTWRMAIEWGWAPMSPWVHARPKAPADPEPIQPPTVEEVRAIIAAAPTSDLALYWSLSARTGARTGELAAIQWADVTANGLVVRRNVTRRDEIRQTKTGTKGHRTVPLDAKMQRMLAKRERRPGVAWVFADNYGDPWRPDRAALAFRRVADDLGVDGSIHGLRHFCATQWLGAGVPITTVSHLLGHANVTTTLNTYGHWLPAQGRDAVEGLGALLDGLG